MSTQIASKSNVRFDTGVQASSLHEPRGASIRLGSWSSDWLRYAPFRALQLLLEFLMRNCYKYRCSWVIHGPRHRWLTCRGSPGTSSHRQSEPLKWHRSRDLHHDQQANCPYALEIAVRVVSWPIDICNAKFTCIAVDVEWQDHHHFKLEAALLRPFSIVILKHKLVESSRKVERFIGKFWGQKKMGGKQEEINSNKKETVGKMKEG